MINRPIYEKQVDLLLKVLPLVIQESCFAIKGGTALNVFVRDLPRLSVDIDLTYLPLNPREQALTEIKKALNRIKGRVIKHIPNVFITENHTKPEKHINRLFIKTPHAQIKIEPNFIMRGSVFPIQTLSLCQSAKDYFKQDIKDAPILSFADLYAGKICAALNRQHPRDLFDIKLLLENEGITSDLLKATIVYLACDKRPMHELISPNIKQNQETLFENEFNGMVMSKLSYDELSTVLPNLITTLKKKFKEEEKEFLLSVARGEPLWDLLDLPHLSELPALRWRVENVKIMSDEKRVFTIHSLKEALEK